MNYVLITLLVAALSAGGVAAWQTTRLEAAQSALVLSTAQLASCGGRLQNLIEDVRSDNAIDTIPDGKLINVPADWLFDPTGNP